MTDKKIFCTSFCNMGHDIQTGKPIGHECYIIPPRLLRLERDQEDMGINEWVKWSSGSRTIHRGIKDD
jgi:hypothetical protein